jgi:hypothetical protein
MDIVLLIYQSMSFDVTSKFKLFHCFKIEFQHSVSKIPELIFHFQAVHLHLDFALHRNHFIPLFSINIQQ